MVLAMERLLEMFSRADSAISGVAEITAEETALWPPQSVEALVAAGILEVATPAEAVSCPACFDDHLLEVLADGSTSGEPGRCYGWCPRTGLVAIPPDLRRRWRVHPDGLARTLSSAFGADANLGVIVPSRLWTLGKLRLHDQVHDVFLARGIGWRDAPQSLDLERLLFGRSAPVVLTLSEPPPSKGVLLVSVIRALRFDGAVCLDVLYLQGILTTAATQVPEGVAGHTAAPTVTITAAEQDECVRHGFNGAFALNLSGRIVLRKSNVVSAGGAEMILPDAEFKVVLRLVVALFETEDGFVARGNRDGGGLVDEGIYPADSIDQVVGRLRSKLRPGLGGLDPRKYIEVSRGCIRLSTHRRYVSANRAVLVRHPDPAIATLATRIPPD